MGLLSWITGIGLPTLLAVACFGGGAYAWFQVPVIGRYAGLVLVAIGTALAANASGYASGRAECQEAAVRAELAGARADIANLQAAAQKADELSDKLTEAERRNAEIVNELSQNRDNSCMLDDATAGRLLRLK